jgi:hypothetical protein
VALGSTGEIMLASQYGLTAGVEAKKLAIQLMKEKGRGGVLLGAARLDYALEKLLKSVMQPNVGGDDNLFDPDRPLGSFSAKISLAYRLRLIDKSVEHTLQMIRKIRNDFAHSFEDTNLSEQAHQNRLTKPYAEARKNALWADLEKFYIQQMPDVAKEYRDFTILVLIVMSFMEACAHLGFQLAPPMQINVAEGVCAVKV